MRLIVLCSILLGLLAACMPVFSKPMPSPSLDEAATTAYFIVVADYQDYLPPDGDALGYFHGPIARYRVVKTLKGRFMEAEVRIRYDFQDGSACLAEAGWSFSDALMPRKNSRWILFIAGPSGSAPGQRTVYPTYRGSFGRKAWNVALEQEVRTAAGETNE